LGLKSSITPDGPPKNPQRHLYWRFFDKALVYRLGALTKAGAELPHQFAMSLMIRQIEDVLQVRLFDRTIRAQKQPTPACRKSGYIRTTHSQGLAITSGYRVS
jgi:hypothetical protein